MGECLRRIIGKVICHITRGDAESICGTSQLCAGLKCGIEGAIHVANELFEFSDGPYGMMLIDANNPLTPIDVHVRQLLVWV